MSEAPGTHNPSFLPSDIPAPQDDGAARHLAGMRLPDVELPATMGAPVNLSRLKGRAVVYVYPRTGVPGVDPPSGWDQIPGARGCTPQSCGFRDHFADLKSLGVDSVFGISTQDTDYQREAAERLHLPFPLLSDAARKLARAANLSHFFSRRNDAAQADGAHRRGRRGSESILSGVPAGQERRGGDRLAACKQVNRTASRAETAHFMLFLHQEISAPARRHSETSLASARRYSCYSASSGSYRTA